MNKIVIILSFVLTTLLAITLASASISGSLNPEDLKDIEQAEESRIKRGLGGGGGVRVARQIDVSQYYDDLVTLQNHLEQMASNGRFRSNTRSRYGPIQLVDYD